MRYQTLDLGIGGDGVPRYLKTLMFYWKLVERLHWMVAYFAQSAKLFRDYRHVAQIWISSIPGLDFANMSNIMAHETSVILLLNNESARFLEIMSTCETGYMDTRQNVADLLPYLNDNAFNKKFVAVDDGFFMQNEGWSGDPVMDAFAYKRLKFVISSGIYAYWNAWYRRIKPFKLFHHYDKWTHPTIEAFTKLDFNSKVATGFYVYGICLLFCLLVLCLELVVKFGSVHGNFRKLITGMRKTIDVQCKSDNCANMYYR